MPLWRGPLVWVTSTRFAPHRQDPLPLALADRKPFLARGQDCEWAGAAVRALEQAGRRYRIAYTSASQIGTHAPVLAGLAVTVSTLSWLPEGLRAMRPEEGLPALPEFGILLLKGKRPLQPVTDALAAHIEESFALDVSRGGGGGVIASGYFQHPGFRHCQPAHIDPVGELRRIGFMVMPVHDQPRRRDLGQPVDRGEAVAMARRRLVRHQHVEAMLRPAARNPRGRSNRDATAAARRASARAA